MFINRGRQAFQTEASKCGLACLATVLSHHGDGTSLAELRHIAHSQTGDLTPLPGLRLRQ